MSVTLFIQKKRRDAEGERNDNSKEHQRRRIYAQDKGAGLSQGVFMGSRYA